MKNYATVGSASKFADEPIFDPRIEDRLSEAAIDATENFQKLCEIRAPYYLISEAQRGSEIAEGALRHYRSFGAYGRMKK